MKQLLLLCTLTLGVISLKSQDLIDTSSQKTDSFTFAYIGTGISYVSAHTAYHGLLGMRFKDLIAIEYELARLPSLRSEWLNRVTLKFYPIDFIYVGAGLQAYGYTDAYHGFFSRFDDDYRQEMDYKKVHDVINAFVNTGFSGVLSEHFFIEGGFALGRGNRTSEIIEVPPDAELLEATSSLNTNLKNRIFLDLKLSLAYRF